MKVIIYGATGMVGQGVLREALRDPEVTAVLVITRTATGQVHPKLREVVVPDVAAFSDDSLAEYDACLFCLGVSAAGMKEAAYRRITYDLTLTVARDLLARNADMIFIYVSGAGTDSSEKGRTMWARVKGQTENALLRLPFEATYMVRPGFIQPKHGIVSKTKLYRMIYAAGGPLYPVWNALFPKYVTTTEDLGRAMLRIAKHGAPKNVLENEDLRALAALAGAAATAA